MGRRGRKSRGTANLIDVSSDDDSISSSSSVRSDPMLANAGTEKVDSLEDDLEKFLDALYEKRSQTREKALAAFVGAFENHMLYSFVENRSFTLLHQFSNSIRRGSLKEVSLASRAIGLLAITIGGQNNAHEIVEETTPHLFRALKSGESSKKISVMDCLAVVTFVAGEDEDTEASMKNIWELINPKLGNNVTPTKQTPALLSSAISAWAFLLTSLPLRSINFINWQESVTLLSNMLDKGDRSVRIAAGEALALIYEMNASNPSISKTAENELESSHPVGTKSTMGISYIETLKGKILTQARDLSMEAGGKGSVKSDLGTQRELFQHIVDFIETEEFEVVSLKVLNHCDPLKITSWSHALQLNFLRRFLGSGYLRHMQDNELLHDILDYVPKKREILSVKEKRMFLSPNSALSKGRTQYLNRRRAIAQGRNQGHFAVGGEEDY